MTDLNSVISEIELVRNNLENNEQARRIFMRRCINEDGLIATAHQRRVINEYSDHMMCAKRRIDELEADYRVAMAAVNRELNDA